MWKHAPAEVLPASLMSYCTDELTITVCILIAHSPSNTDLQSNQQLLAMLLCLLTHRTAGDVVYLRLASAITADARNALLAQLAKDIKPALKANSRAQQALQDAGLAAALKPNSRLREQAQQAQQKVSRPCSLKVVFCVYT
jgi:hypothetical protein